MPVWLVLHWSITTKLVSQVVGRSLGFGKVSSGVFYGVLFVCWFRFGCFVWGVWGCLFLLLLSLGLLLCWVVFWDGKTKKNCLKNPSEDFWLLCAGRVIQQGLNIRRQYEMQWTVDNMSSYSVTWYRQMEETGQKEPLKKDLGIS